MENRDNIDLQLDEYLVCVETAFEISHKLVELRTEPYHEAGTVWSIIRNFIRKVDFDYYEENAKVLFEDCLSLRERASLICGSQNSQLTDALLDYTDAIYAISEVFARKTEFCAGKSNSSKTPGTSYREFRQIVKGETTLLDKCQETGDKLTTIYKAILLKNRFYRYPNRFTQDNLLDM